MREFEKISSKDNRRLIVVRKVREGRDRSRIFIEGRRLVEEALRSEVEFDECFISESFRNHGIVEAIFERTESIAVLPDHIFLTIADTQQSQGIILLAKRPETGADKIEARLATAALSIVVFLYEINNPANLGAIVRTAEAADVVGTVVSQNSADIYSPKSLRASMGASLRLPIWANQPLETILEWAKANNLLTTATAAVADDSYTAIDWSVPRLLIFGSEAHGLGCDNLESVHEKIKIPMANEVESLNLAVSAGIILFEATRQAANLPPSI